MRQGTEQRKRREGGDAHCESSRLTGEGILLTPKHLEGILLTPKHLNRSDEHQHARSDWTRKDRWCLGRLSGAS